MKNKKLIIITVIFIVIMVILVSFLILCIFTLNKNNNIDLNILDSKINEVSTFNDARMKKITISNINEIFDIDENYIDGVIGKIPLIDIYSSMYVVIEAKQGYEDIILQKLQEYGKKYEEKWSTYMEDQYQIVLNRKIDKKGRYVYMVVSDNIDEILNYIK